MTKSKALKILNGSVMIAFISIFIKVIRDGQCFALIAPDSAKT